MLTATGNSVQEVASTRIVIILTAIALVVYWRTVIKVALAILAIAAVALIGAGAFEFLSATHG
jgi:hypothetical protein